MSANRRRGRASLSARAACVAAVLCLPALACNQVLAGEAVRWRVVPYAWAAGVDGELEHARLPLTLHPRATFGDVLENLDAAGMLAIDAQGERFGVWADALLADVSRDVRVPIGPYRLPVAASAKTRTGLIAMQYRLAQGGNRQLDIVLGARHWDVDTRFAYQIAAEVPVGPLPRSYSASQGQSWWDVQVGAKGQYTFDRGFFVSGLALVGSGGSNLAYDLMLIGGYRINDRVAWFVGYRRMDVDFRTAQGFAFDAALHGPGIGLELQF